MAHVGTLRDFRFENQADDIRGAALYGRDDDKLGKIDDVVFDHSSGQLKYVVVDTGGWLSSKQFLVPADRIRQRGEKDDEFVADLSKKQIESFPPYDENHLSDEKRWGDYERDYSKASGFEETGGVLHQAGGTNILIPDDIPVTGSGATSSSSQPIEGYKSPIRHQTAGMMDTTPMGVGQNTNDQTLTFVPDSLGTGRGDIEDMRTDAEEFASSNTSSQSIGSEPVRSVGEAAEISRTTRARDIANREDDRFYHTDRGSKLSQAERTIEGDAIFNSEDIAGRTQQAGNVHSVDSPSYSTVVGQGTQTTAGRTPTYPDAGQGQRWARFEENLRRQRPQIIGHCSVCESGRREDEAA